MAGSNLDRTKQTNETDRLLSILESKVGTVEEKVSALEEEIIVTPDTDGILIIGSVANSYRAITSARTLDDTDYTVDCTSGTFTVTLPTVVGIEGRVYNIKNTGTGVITVSVMVDSVGGETIDGETTQTLNQGDNMQVQCNGSTGWIII